MEHHVTSGQAADRTEAFYQGRRLDDEPMDRLPDSFGSPARQRSPVMPVIGGQRPDYAPWHWELIKELYADTGVFT